MERRVDLDVIGVLEGSEKSSSYRSAGDYLRHYESLFAPWRAADIVLWEIGARRGAALRLWQWYFSRATIVCLDADAQAASFAGPRVQMRIGARQDRAFLENVAAEFPPTIIIDSGVPHQPAVMNTFRILFPLLAENGIYVVEGLETKQAESGELAGFFWELAQAGMARRAGGKHAALTRDVDEIGFMGGAVAVRRRAESRDLAHALATADAYLTAQRRDSGALERLAAYVLRHGGKLSRAEAAIDAAIESEGMDLPRLLMKIEIMLAQGRKEDAAEALARAAAWPDAPAPYKHRLARLQMQSGDKAGALVSAEASVVLDPGNQAFRKLRDNLVRQ